MDRRNRNDESVITFTNQGFCGDQNMDERRMDQPLNSSRLCNYVNGSSAIAEDSPNDMPISECLRQFALEGISERQHSRNIEEAKQTNYQNGCIIFLTIILILAPIAISTYVFLKHELMVSPCSTNVFPSITPSMLQSDVNNAELRKLIDDLKVLQNKYQELKTQSGGKPSESIREQRRRRQNCSSSSDSSTYQASLDKIRRKFSAEGSKITIDCFSELRGINSKINDIRTKLDEETNSCIFKIENNTQVDYVKNVQKVQINENKDTAVQLVGVTCCTEYNTSNISNAVLEVKETISNITYTCYCMLGLQKCNICYWQCADTRSHHIK